MTELINPLGFFNKRIFRLDERHVVRRIVSFNSLADPMCGNHFKLNDDIMEWFEDQNASFTYKEISEYKSLKPSSVTGSHQSLGNCQPTLYLDDVNIATLFKLAWM